MRVYAFIVLLRGMVLREGVSNLSVEGQLGCWKQAKVTANAITLLMTLIFKSFCLECDLPIKFLGIDTSAQI